MRKGDDPDPEPYLWLMDLDPGGPKTYGSRSGSGSPTLVITVSMKNRDPMLEDKSYCIASHLCSEFLGGDLQHDGPGHQQPHPAEQGAQAHRQRARLQGQQGEHQWWWNGFMTRLVLLILFDDDRHTANEGPVRIQHKCLVPFMYSQKWNCYFQNRIIMFRLPVPTVIYLWEIYIFPGSFCLFCC